MEPRSHPEAILDALAGGLSIRTAAKRFDVSEAEVREILKQAVERCSDGAHMRESWMLEDRRLAAVGLKFFHRAMEGDGDPASAVAFIKVSERRATLAGANIPQSHVLQVVSQPPEYVRTTTDEMEAALDRVMGVSTRERALRNRLLADEELSPTSRPNLASCKLRERPSA